MESLKLGRGKRKRGDAGDGPVSKCLLAKQSKRVNDPRNSVLWEDMVAKLESRWNLYSKETFAAA